MKNNGFTSQHKEYIARINRVLDYIEIHLTESLTLEELASVSCFSPFHFHRIFRAFVGETVGQYISRIRLEKAATLLLSNPDKSITAIALDCGFSGSTTFARAFKESFGISASAWRETHRSDQSRNCKAVSKKRQPLRKPGEVFIQSSGYIYAGNQQQLTWRIEMNTKPKMTADVVVKKANEMTVAYVRNIGSYKNNPALFQRLITKLCTWAGPRGLLKNAKPIIAIYHDSPITPEDKQRLSICIEVPENTEVGGEIGKMTIPAGEYAYARFELEAGQFEEAWNMVYNGWLPETGYQPDDRPCFEVYYNDPKDHPEHKFVMDVVIAVKPA
ncbi:MAG: GyrI-like domain-containing protein [Candidatus Neomarinimicrobiota bacterium]